MKQQLLFDLDDTLIYCNRYFFEVIDQFADSLKTWFNGYSAVTDSAIRDKQMEFDLALIDKSGFKSEHFPRSFLNTYQHFCAITGRDCSKQEENFLWDIGISVYQHDTEPYPNMEQTLTQLASEGHELHLYTGGEPKIQQRKIDQMELGRFFESRIYIRQLKNYDALEGILRSGSFDRTQTWMIGNSIRTDVVPALTAGIHAIHMQAQEEWHYNIIPIDLEPKGAFLRLQQLLDIPHAIKQFVSR